jgi:phage terminase small subunit
MEKDQKLTLKQRKFIKYYLGCGNASEAARKAGYATDRQQGYENLTKPYIRQAFISFLDKKGLTDEKIVDKLMELIEAKRQISANITYGDADEKTTDFIEVPDNQTQIKALELLIKLKSLIGDDVRATIIDKSQHLTQILLADKLKEARERKTNGTLITAESGT